MARMRRRQVGYDRKPTRTDHSRYGRRTWNKNRRGSSILVNFGMDMHPWMERGFFSKIPFPRAVARMFGAKWVSPKRRGR